MDKLGFTLMELMIAAAILALTLGALIAASTANFALVESGRNLTTAVNHARCVIEEIRDHNIPSLVTTEDWTTWAQTDHPDGGGCNTLNNESVQVSYPSGTVAEPLEIEITVNWTEKGRPRNVQLITLLAER